MGFEIVSICQNQITSPSSFSSSLFDELARANEQVDKQQEKRPVL